MTLYRGDTLHEAMPKAVWGENYETKKGGPKSRTGKFGSKPSASKIFNGRASGSLDQAVRAAVRSVRNVERNSGRGSESHGTIIYRNLIGRYTWQLPNDSAGDTRGIAFADGFSQALAYVKGQGFAGQRPFEASQMARSRMPPSSFRTVISRLAGRMDNSEFKGYWVTHSTNHAANRSDRFPASVFEVSAGGTVRLWG